MKNPSGESARQSLIIRFLCEIPRSRLIRLYNCPPFSSKEGRYIRRSSSLTPDGLPDLLFISEKYGVHFFEVKSDAAYKMIERRIDHFRKTINVDDSYRHVKKQIKLIDELNTYLVVKASIVNTVDHVRKALGIPDLL